MLKRVLRKKLVLAGVLVVSVSLLAPMGVKAQDGNGYCDESCSESQSGNYEVSQIMNIEDTQSYSSTIITEISITGEDVEVSGLVRALSKNDQFVMLNEIDNYGTENEGSVSGDVLSGAQGNIGTNVVAGDFNSQSNIVAIATGEQETSLVESKTFSVQKAEYNYVNNEGVTNTASASDNVLSGAQGNIGLNIAAGVDNAQTNQLGIAVGSAKVGIAVAYVQQKSKYNTVSNQPIVEETEGEGIPIELEVQMNEDISGNLDGSYTGTEEGTIWDSFGNPENTYTGDAEGTVSGDIGIENIELTGTITGSIPIGIANINTTNTASLSGSVLSSAVGNIGVNVAAGSNNLQTNTLSVSYTSASESVIPVSSGI